MDLCNQQHVLFVMVSTEYVELHVYRVFSFLLTKGFQLIAYRDWISLSLL